MTSVPAVPVTLNEYEPAKVPGEPVPLSATVCGLLAALSAMVRVPARLPAAVGVKVTLIAQLAPAAIDAAQLLLAPKSPLAAMLVMLKAAFPVFLSVTVCGALAIPYA